jgi:hypothetical protein
MLDADTNNQPSPPPQSTVCAESVPAPKAQGDSPMFRPKLAPHSFTRPTACPPRRGPWNPHPLFPSVKFTPGVFLVKTFTASKPKTLTNYKHTTCSNVPTVGPGEHTPEQTPEHGVNTPSGVHPKSLLRLNLKCTQSLPATCLAGGGTSWHFGVSTIAKTCPPVCWADHQNLSAIAFWRIAKFTPPSLRRFVASSLCSSRMPPMNGATP